MVWRFAGVLRRNLAKQMDLRFGDRAIDRLLTRSRRYPYLVDAAVAVLIAVLGFLGRTVASSWADEIVYAGLVLGCCLALTFRRRAPRISLTIMFALLGLHVVALERVGIFVGVVCLIAAYTTQTQLDPPWRWVFLAVVYLGAVGVTLTSGDSPFAGGWINRLPVAAFVCAVLTVAALIGALRRRTRAHRELTLERAAFLESQRNMEQRLASIEKRNQIAREMHDILGHSLNAIAMQAEGARYALRPDPDIADRALADIGDMARDAVDEIRDLLDVLRADDHLTRTGPAPSLHNIPELVEAFDGAGAVIGCQVDGDARSVPAHVGLAAYRIVQESLTNAVKHANQAPITIRASVSGDEVKLLIVNDGPKTRWNPPPTKPGHGLIGMRERVRAIGGTLDVGADRAMGGWRVAATLPWRRP